MRMPFWEALRRTASATDLNGDVKMSLFACATGRHLYSEHTADQRQLFGTGPAGAERPSAAAPGHERISGSSRSHSELQLNSA